MVNLANYIEELISSLDSGNVSASSDKAYQEIFANEGAEKAKPIIEDLIERSRQYSLDLSNFAYLSIGGADGSEAEAVLMNTAIEMAVLLEYSDSATAIARQKADYIKQSLSKQLMVLQGDAIRRLDEALKLIRESHTGIVCSAQAILHELPKRSDSFRDFPTFFGKVFKDFEACALYAREPSRPNNWPDYVRIRIPSVKGDRLAVLARRISERLRIESCLESFAGEEVLMSSVLAVETLHKLLRSKDSSEFIYEMDEQLTSFDPDCIVPHIENFLGRDSTRFKYLTTEGFSKAYEGYGIIAKNHSTSQTLPIPSTHVQILAFKANRIDSSFQEYRNLQAHYVETASQFHEISSLQVQENQKFTHVEQMPTSSSLHELNQDDIVKCNIISLASGQNLEAATVAQWLETLRKQLENISSESVFNKKALPDAPTVARTLKCVLNVQTSISKSKNSIKNLRFQTNTSMVIQTLLEDQGGVKFLLNQIEGALRGLAGGASRQDGNSVGVINSFFLELDQTLSDLINELLSNS